MFMVMGQVWRAWKTPEAAPGSPVRVLMPAPRLSQTFFQASRHARTDPISRPSLDVRLPLLRRADAFSCARSAAAEGVPGDRDSGRVADRAGPKGCAAHQVPGVEARHQGRVHPGHRLRRLGRGPDQPQGRPGLVRRFHVRAGVGAVGRQGDPDRAAGGR
ncbi:hypothetical protein VARIO8X_130154 [Burkholderiales bacterium 8X]|nr:hypothetical protein VARIO8X_130154 [Burkholderiales bacterium 8X]